MIHHPLHRAKLTLGMDYTVGWVEHDSAWLDDRTHQAFWYEEISTDHVGLDAVDVGDPKSTLAHPTFPGSFDQEMVPSYKNLSHSHWDNLENDTISGVDPTPLWSIRRASSPMWRMESDKGKEPESHDDLVTERLKRHMSLFRRGRTGQGRYSISDTKGCMQQTGCVRGADMPEIRRGPIEGRSETIESDASCPTWTRWSRLRSLANTTLLTAAQLACILPLRTYDLCHNHTPHEGQDALLSCASLHGHLPHHIAFLGSTSTTFFVFSALAYGGVAMYEYQVNYQDRYQRVFLVFGLMVGFLACWDAQRVDISHLALCISIALLISTCSHACSQWLYANCLGRVSEGHSAVSMEEKTDVV
jgi:hypothetical protein